MSSVCFNVPTNGASNKEHRDYDGARAYGLSALLLRRSGPDGESERKEDDEEDVSVPEWDEHGDTDTEGALTEAPVTPSSSFGLGDLSVHDEEHEIQGNDKDTTRMAMQEKSMGLGVEVVQSTQDTDLMDVAYVLCGLSQRR